MLAANYQVQGNLTYRLPNDENPSTFYPRALPTTIPQPPSAKIANSHVSNTIGSHRWW